LTKKKAGEGFTNQAKSINIYIYVFLFFYSEDIVAIGTDDDIARAFEGKEVEKKIDASGCCILPGEIKFKICYK